MPNEMANRRDDCWCGERKRMSKLSNQKVYCFVLITAQSLAQCGSDGSVRVDARSVAIQSEQVGFFCGLRERAFCMDNVAPASLLTDRMSGFFTLSNTELLLPRGKGDFVDFYLACRFPDDKVWHIGMRGSL